MQSSSNWNINIIEIIIIKNKDFILIKFKTIMITAIKLGIKP